jgi:pimeloyl-ACP methyl ester carboxylesterase
MTYEIPGARQHWVETNGVRLSVYEAGQGPPVVLSHGFPELAYSWRHQFAALAAAGYRVIAPDQRGYGASDRPAAIEDYDLMALSGDLIGLLDALEIDEAVFVGHDWGGLITWPMPLLHPGRVAGLIGVNTPYLPRLPMRPTEVFRMAGGEGHYVLYFQEPGVADAALAEDVSNLFQTMMQSGVPPEELQAATGDAGNFMEAIARGPRLGEPLLSADELSVYVDTFEETGFTGGLNWYRNFDRNWEHTPTLDGARIDVPSLMVTAEWDPVLTPAVAQIGEAFVDDLETHLVERCGHWTQQEHPDELNRVMIDWLDRRYRDG